MRKAFTAMIVIAIALFMVAPAFSADKVLETKISDMVERTDRNGDQYVRFIVEETRTTAGVSYPAGVPVMAFGHLVEKAKTMNTGDTLKCVVQEREYQGRKSYTILAFIE